MKIIFAPHIDDELIGCFSLFSLTQPNSDIKVLYFFEINDERMREVNVLSDRLGFNYHVIRRYQHENIQAFIRPDDVLYIPHIKDEHQAHKLVNTWGRVFPNEKKYYSTTMNVCRRTLDSVHQFQKTQLLERYYPSQQLHFDAHPEWFLFESIQETDLERYITVSNSFIGFHSYSQAPDEVSFLSHRHRHRFFVQSKIEVFSDNRELEFFMVQSRIEQFIQNHLKDDLGSCEMIAERILNFLLMTYSNQLRNIEITVSEDNENSSSVVFKPHL